jgi:hypothetical protein
MERIGMITMDVGHAGVTWVPNPDGDELGWMRREGQNTKGYPPNEWWTYLFSEEESFNGSKWLLT